MSSSTSSEGEGEAPLSESQVLVENAALALRRGSWFSWWSQVILTTISSITLLFAKSVLSTGRRQASSTGRLSSGIGGDGFFLAGTGVILSGLSILWTWGAAARLSRRLTRRAVKDEDSQQQQPQEQKTRKKAKALSTILSRTTAANMLRRVVRVGVVLNLAGMFITLLGAEQIVGSLAAKVLTTSTTTSGVGGPSVALGPTVQPLDILIVQANTNTLLSHFVSLSCLLYLTKSIDRLDPPSINEDDDNF